MIMRGRFEYCTQMCWDLGLVTTRCSLSNKQQAVLFSSLAQMAGAANR